MRKLVTAVFPQAVLILYLTLLLVVAADIQTAKGENILTVEGVWVTTSSNYPDKDGGYTIVRQGDGYNAIPKNAGPGKKYHGVGLYYGSSTEIMAKSNPSFDALMDMFGGENIPTSILRELAGKVNLRFKFKLSADGQSMEHSHDYIMVHYYKDTGRLQRYEIMPYGDKAILVRVATPAPAKKALTSAMAQVESRGEFYVLTKDGRKLTGKDADQIPLEEGTKVITGSSGHIRMKLPDDTTFTIGPNSDIVIDKFVYDDDKGPKTIIANVSKGVFRWVTGKVKPLQDLAEMKVKLPVMHVGIRGTDFEATVNPDGSGSVVLHLGQLEITENKTGFTFILNAGYKVTFNTDGSVSRPIKVD